MNQRLTQLKTRYSDLKTLIRDGAILFAVCISLSYALYPHWVTFSHFANRWYTFIPFAIAIGTCGLLLWKVGSELRRHANLRSGGTVLIASAVSASLILCVPYAGSSIQKDIHNMIALLFVLLAACGLAITAKRWRFVILGVISGALVGICVIELTLLARYVEHPVSPWIWTVLQLILTPLIIVALYTIAHELERRKLLT